MPRDSGGGPLLKRNADSHKFDWHRAIARCGLPQITKLIAYALWDFTDQNGTNAHPGNPLLAEITGFSMVTVKRHMATLRAEQWITRVTASNSHPDRKWADVYNLTMPVSGISQETPDTAQPGISQGIPGVGEPGISQEIPDQVQDRLSPEDQPGISESQPGISESQPGISQEIPQQSFSINPSTKNLDQEPTPPDECPPALPLNLTPPEIEAAKLKAAGTNPEAVDYIRRLRPPKGTNEYAIARSRLQRCRGLTGPEIWELALSKRWIHQSTTPPAWASALLLEEKIPPARAGITP
ncbi:hypothetical protein [Arthrobacter sp. UYCu712]|uniref:hypothetical protein n=1 Tax=Arthrobacter sp. UYCu712 TaxID=3156340 RepID=UPI003396097D